MPDAQRQEVGAAGTGVLRAGGVSEERIRELEKSGRPVTIARAMSLVSVIERMIAGGLTAEEVDALFPALVEADLTTPHAHADAVTGLVRRLSDLGVGRGAAISLAFFAAHAKTAAVAEAALDVEQSVRLGLDAGISAGTAGDLVLCLLDGERKELKSRVESALALVRARAGSRQSVEEAARALVAKPREGSGMTDPKMRNGSGPVGGHDREREKERLDREREALDREREKKERLDREREALDREREKMDRERERLDRIQEELEERLERQEGRLEQLEEELEERMEALDEAASELDEISDIEVDGIEGVREMLDAVTARMPNIMRGIQESIYSPERTQATADAFATFYKTLVASGMPDYAAAEMTRQHFDVLQSQMRAQMGQRRPTRRGRATPGPDFDPLGPNFDPLGPNFDPFGCTSPEPPEPAKPAEPREPGRA